MFVQLIQYVASFLNNLPGNKYMKVMSLKLLLINISGYLKMFLNIISDKENARLNIDF